MRQVNVFTHNYGPPDIGLCIVEGARLESSKIRNRLTHKMLSAYDNNDTETALRLEREMNKHVTGVQNNIIKMASAVDKCFRSPHEVRNTDRDAPILMASVLLSSREDDIGALYAPFTGWETAFVESVRLMPCMVEKLNELSGKAHAQRSAAERLLFRLLKWMQKKESDM